ncbi:hypothetical protein ACSBR2_013728 [Camellia fascicularis]
MDEVEDLIVDDADGYSRVNTDTVHSVAVGIGVSTTCDGKRGGASPGCHVTSLVRRVKNKPRHEFRLIDFEYPAVGRRAKQSSRVVLHKSTDPGVIYSVEDIVDERKTWNGFARSKRHAVWNMLKDDEVRLLETTYSLDGDGALVWDGGENGVQMNFMDVQDLVQQNSIHGNVSTHRIIVK